MHIVDHRFMLLRLDKKHDLPTKNKYGQPVNSMFVKTCFFNMFFNGAVGAVVGCTALLHPFPAHKHAGGQMSYVCPPAFKMLRYDYFTVCI